MAGNEFKMLMPPFLHFFFAPASNPIEHQEEADHVVVTTKWHLAQKCIYPNIKVLPASKGFTAQLAIINNACFCSSIVHRDDVMFKQQSNINLLFYLMPPSHLILFLNWDNASALKFEQCHLCLFLLHQSTRGIVCFFSGIESPIVTLFRTYVHWL